MPIMVGQTFACQRFIPVLILQVMFSQPFSILVCYIFGDIFLYVLLILKYHVDFVKKTCFIEVISFEKSFPNQVATR